MCFFGSQHSTFSRGQFDFECDFFILAHNLLSIFMKFKQLIGANKKITK